MQPAYDDTYGTLSLGVVPFGWHGLQSTE
ncbi:hypothetical protein LINPERHAP2_LOCUS30062 [Linum perenne]